MKGYTVMVMATLTSKGQITIPKSIRKSLHLNTGDKVAFVMHGDGNAVLKPVTKSVDEVFGRLHREDTPVLSVEQMNDAIKSRFQGN